MPLGRQVARSSCTRGGDEGEGGPRCALHSGQAEHLPLASRQVPATAACPLGAYVSHHSSVNANNPLCLLPEPSPKSDLSQVLRKTLSLRVAFICLSLVLVAMIVLQAVFCKSPGPWRPQIFSCYFSWCFQCMMFLEVSCCFWKSTCCSSYPRVLGFLTGIRKCLLSYSSGLRKESPIYLCLPWPPLALRPLDSKPVDSSNSESDVS